MSDSNTSPVSTLRPENMTGEVLLFDASFSRLSVRAQNILRFYRAQFDDSASFIKALSAMSEKDVSRLRNCGRKTTEEIISFCSSLNSSCVSKEPAILQTAPRKIVPANVDRLLPLIESLLGKYSVRCQNVFRSFLYDDNNGSLANLYSVITAPTFKPKGLRNIGKKTVPEIIRLFDSITLLLESFTDDKAIEKYLTELSTKNLDDQNIPREDQRRIFDLEASLGYFPLFSTIKSFLASLDEESRTIAKECIRIHEGQVIHNLEEIAAAWGVSRERVRQKRNKLFESLESFLVSIRTLGFVDKCPYSYQMTHINKTINATEGTDFSLNFVNWVLGYTYEEVTLLGDVIKTLTAFYPKNRFLCLVPTELCQYIDFSAFIEDIETRLTDKRFNEEKVNLQNIINSHLKTQYCEDEMPTIETSCRSILYLHYPVDVDFGQVIFKPNARKTNPVAIEDIIRSAGHPLTLEEIYNEFIYQYPERYTEMSALRGSISSNPNILPIGRTSTYTLVEWESDTLRGGSIRQIVADYLRALEPTIAPIATVSEHVCKFRPTTDERNIISNLHLDQSGLFSFFFRDGIRYIGLAENTYPLEFFPYSKESRKASTMSIFYPRLIAFIESHGRFPFSSGVDNQELSLCSFWLRQERRFKAGELTTSGLAYHTKILDTYSSLLIDKKEYEWQQVYDRFKTAIVNKNIRLLTAQDWKWFSRNADKYKYRKSTMSLRHRAEFEYILSSFSN